MIAKTWRFCTCSRHMVHTFDVGFLAVSACPMVVFSKAGAVFRRDAENRIQLGPPRVFTHYQAIDL